MMNKLAYIYISIILSFIQTINGTVEIKPNIVFIMADDLGWGNVGYHNKENPEVQTPNIDYLVEHGLQLNRHYVDPECSPTRSSFQSGRLPVHVNTNNNDGITDSTMGIHPDMTCIASKLKEAGYSNHLIGKWDAGFASFKQIPIARGYDTSYGYLSKTIEYYTKIGNSVCTHKGEMTDIYIDLWENDHPAKEDISHINMNEYVENIFAKKLYTKIDEMSFKNNDKDIKENDPFFLFYASHLPHFPAQLPIDCIEKGYYNDFEDDESQCGILNDEIFPGYYEDKTTWKCRSIMQAQVAVLDDIIGEITYKLKENNLWENTLLIFTSDNGGSLELDKTAGNNYPLRGGKSTYFEGGIRAIAFISGGYLPESRHGKIEEGMIHISDWYTTFCEMFGIDKNDYNAIQNGLPNVDGYNMWPLISGQITQSPRNELIMGKNTLLSGDYKLITGSSTKYAIWQGPKFPNASTPSQNELLDMKLICNGNDNDGNRKYGCLFNVVSDPSEHNDISNDFPSLTFNMYNRLQQVKNDFYSSDFVGTDSCPDGFEAIAQNYVNVDLNLETNTNIDACGCWMSVNNYNKFAGPYMDLTPEEIYYDIDKFQAEIKDSINNNNQEIISGVLNHIGIKEYIYIGAVFLVFIVLSAMVYWCRNMKNVNNSLRKKKQCKKKSRPNYGTYEDFE